MCENSCCFTSEKKSLRATDICVSDISGALREPLTRVWIVWEYPLMTELESWMKKKLEFVPTGSSPKRTQRYAGLRTAPSFSNILFSIVTRASHSPLHYLVHSYPAAKTRTSCTLSIPTNIWKEWNESDDIFAQVEKSCHYITTRQRCSIWNARERDEMCTQDTKNLVSQKV